MSTDADPTGQPSATRGVAPPPPPRKVGPPEPRRPRVSNPFVTAVVCALCVAGGGIGGMITAHSAGVLSGMRASGRYVFTEPFRSPVLFVALCVVAIVAALLWVRRLLRPRPAWALCLAFAFVVAVIAVASIGLASER